jgi:hypothetical protein
MASSVSANNLIDIKLPDNQWKLVGVNGGFIENSIDDTYLTKDETQNDNAFTDVWYSGGSIVSFMVINSTPVNEFNNPVSMSVDSAISGYSGTYAQREMYVKDLTGPSADIRIKYQANYEGSTFFLVLNGLQYSGKFESNATHENPQTLAKVVSTTGGNLALSYVIDRNLSNNPGQVARAGIKNSYGQENNQDDIGSSDEIRVYWYDAKAGQWKAYIKSSNVMLSNDFSSLEKGKGYWIKFNNSDNLSESGLILGDEGISATDYTGLNMTEGWNMLSFNDSMLIGTGATGMIVDLTAAVATHFNLADSIGTDSIDINITDTNLSLKAQNINKQVAQVKAYGSLSKNFNIVAYDINSSAFLLASDKQFKITNGITDNINQFLDINESVMDIDVVASESNTSVYGHYVLGLKLLAGTSTAIANNRGLETFGLIDLNGSDVEVSGGAGDINASVSPENNISNANSWTNAFSIDTNFDLIADTILVVSPYKFYVKDKVFLKRYDAVSSTFAGTLRLDLNNSTYKSITTNDRNTTITHLGTEINTSVATSPTTSAIATYVSDSRLYIATNKEYLKDFKLNQDTGTEIVKLVVDSTSDINNSGAVAEVYSLENLARATVLSYEDYNSTTVVMVVDINGTANDDNESNLTISNIAIDYNRSGTEGTTSGDRNLTIRLGNDINTSSYINLSNHNYMNYNYSVSDINISFNNISNESNSTIASAIKEVLDIYISSSYNKKYDLYIKEANVSGKTITLYGQYNYEANESEGTVSLWSTGSAVSRSHIRADQFGDTTAVTTTESNISSIPNITSDLGFAKVYASELPTESTNPIVTVQDKSGLKVKKLLTTNERANTSGMSWNFTDLTKDSSEWFDATDSYSLFSFEKEKGYWVYLTNGGDQLGDLAGKLSITNVIYDHELTNNTGVTATSYQTINTIRSGTISVDTSSLTNGDLVNRGFATMGSYKIALTESGTRWVANFSEYTTGNLGTGDINVTATLFTPSSFSATTSTNLSKAIPTKPSIVLTNGDTRTVAITSTPGAINKIYSTDLNETDLTKNLVDGNVSSTFNLCKVALSYSTSFENYKAVSVAGEFNKAPVSDISLLGDSSSDTFYPIYKNSSIITIDGTTSSSSTSKSYNSSCEINSTLPTNVGFTLKSVSGETNSITVAYETNASVTTNGLSPTDIKIVQLKVADQHIATLEFDGRLYPSISTKYVFIDYSGAIYRTTQSALNSADGSYINLSSGDIYMTTGQKITY